MTLPVMRSHSARSLQSLPHRTLSTTTTYSPATSSALPPSSSTLPTQLASGDPTATADFLKSQHDTQAHRTSLALSRFSKTLSSLSYLLPTLSSSLKEIRPPRSASKANSLRPSTTPPYSVLKWQKLHLRAEDRTIKYTDLAERIRLHLEDLQREPFPSEVGLDKAREIRESVKDLDDDAKRQKLREMNMHMAAMQARAREGVNQLQEGVEGLRAVEEAKYRLQEEKARLSRIGRVEWDDDGRRATELSRTVGGKEEGVKGRTAAEARTSTSTSTKTEEESAEASQKQFRSRAEARAARRREIQRNSRRKKRDARRAEAKSSVTSVPVTVNEDGTVSFSPMVTALKTTGGSVSEEHSSSSVPSSVQGKGATAAKGAKLKAGFAGVPSPVKREEKEAKQEEKTADEVKGAAGDGGGAENNATSAKTKSLRDLQALLEKNVNGI